LNRKRRGVKEGLEFVLAYLSRPFSPGEALLSLSLHQSDLDGLEDQYLFDVAFATKWVQPREMLLLAPTGREWGVLLLY
jgi:hypothetical protein